MYDNLRCDYMTDAKFSTYYLKNEKIKSIPLDSLSSYLYGLIEKT